MSLRVEVSEREVREHVKRAGGIWKPERRVWELRFDQVVLLGLEERIVAAQSIYLYMQKEIIMDPISLITANSAIGSVISLPLITKMKDAFRDEEELLIEWTAPNWERIELLFGVITYEKGERRTFRLRGKPGFIAAVVQHLGLNGTVAAQKLLSQ